MTSTTIFGFLAAGKDDSFAAKLIFGIYRGELPFAAGRRFALLRDRARKEAEFTRRLRPKSTFDQLIGRPV